MSQGIRRCIGKGACRNADVADAGQRDRAGGICATAAAAEERGAPARAAVAGGRTNAVAVGIIGIAGGDAGRGARLDDFFFQ